MLDRLKKLTQNELIEIFENNGMTIDRETINDDYKDIKLTIINDNGKEVDFDTYTFFDDSFITGDDNLCSELIIKFETKIPRTQTHIDFYKYDGTSSSELTKLTVSNRMGFFIDSIMNKFSIHNKTSVA